MLFYDVPGINITYYRHQKGALASVSAASSQFQDQREVWQTNIQPIAKTNQPRLPEIMQSCMPYKYQVCLA